MKRTQKSQKRTKYLLLLLVLTAILSITATYAWFSTQRDVEITGMRLNVEVAESMQISLNGETWTQSITIEDMKQFYGTATGTNLHQAGVVGTDTNTNYVPTELKPVSTVGTLSSGTLKFVKGTVNVSNTATSLTDITACSEETLASSNNITARQNGNEAHPYLVFDMYLRNISARTSGLDTLYLNENSKVWVDTSVSQDEGAGVAGTGLEYSARVGLVRYSNTVDVNDTTATGETVRGITTDDTAQVAIWEPNDLDHTPYVVSNNKLSITSTQQAVTTYGIKDTATGTIADVYKYTDTTNLAEVKTMKPEYDADGTKEAEEITLLDGSSKMGLKPNTISKVRVYVWLEGQDPDCIDLASTGDKLNINLRFWKDTNRSGSNISYDTTT